MAMISFNLMPTELEKNHQIPAAYDQWGSFNILAEQNNVVLKGISKTQQPTRRLRRGPTSERLATSSRQEWTPPPSRRWDGSQWPGDLKAMMP